jgi:hypothetical protein
VAANWTLLIIAVRPLVMAFSSVTAAPAARPAPRNTPSRNRRYEALRTYFVDELSAAVNPNATRVRTRSTERTVAGTRAGEGVSTAAD